MHKAAQRLHHAAAILELQPKLQSWHEAGKCSIHRGWSGRSQSPDVSTRMAGPVQPPQERHDSHGHSLEATERVCTQEKANPQFGKKASIKSKTGTKHPSTGSTTRVLKKVSLKKHCKLCKKHGGVHTTHSTKDCCKYAKDGLVRADFYATKKVGKKPNLDKQSFAQWS